MLSYNKKLNNNSLKNDAQLFGTSGQFPQVPPVSLHHNEPKNQIIKKPLTIIECEP